jgi:hypothetical protein
VLRTVTITVAAAVVLQVCWRLFLATSGGDLAAQDFWANAASKYPGSAYNFAWYGGMHVPSYSVGSPYLMAWIGVKPTLMLAGVVASALTALLVSASGAVRNPLVPALLGALAWTGNTVSGRATFAVGMCFALGAVALVFLGDAHTLPWRRRLPRMAGSVLCAVFATFGSPVAGFFLGLLAAAIWCTADNLPGSIALRTRLRWTLGHLFVRDRLVAYSLGLPPVVVVILSAVLFPFSGQQPMHWPSIVLPVLTGLFAWSVAPLEWRLVRVTGLVYVVAVIAAWLIPTEIGTNVTRMALIFGPVVLAAILMSGRARNPLVRLRLPAVATVVLMVLTGVIWQAAGATVDAVHSRPNAAFTADSTSIVSELESRQANLGRIEVVPTRSHIEASTLGQYFTLARGWNRQADLKRNPLFYDSSQPLTASAYHYWLQRWAVSYVVLPPGDIDPSSQDEADLVLRAPRYLKLVWADANWRLYQVVDPTPLVAEPGALVHLDEAHMTISVSEPGTVLVRMLYSPWLGLEDASGKLLKAPKVSADGTRIRNRNGCVAPAPEPIPGQPAPADGSKPEQDVWTQLWAPRAGVYTLAAPYSAQHGTPCPTLDDDTDDSGE